MLNKHIEGRHKAQWARVIEHVRGCYEAQEVPFGIAYRWCPECIVFECGCGERTTLTGSTPTCAWCGTDHAAIVQEWLGTGQPEEDEAVHPWRYAGNREDAGIPC